MNAGSRNRRLLVLARLLAVFLPLGALGGAASGVLHPADRWETLPRDARLGR